MPTSGRRADATGTASRAAASTSTAGRVQLDCNEGRNHLHGGREGFDRKVWTAVFDPAGTTIRFEASSADGEMGFPGAVDVSATYEFDADEVRVTMECRTSAPTIVNMVHHSYFNLAGHDAGDVLGHEVTIDGSFYTPVDDELLATGEILRSTGLPSTSVPARRSGLGSRSFRPRQHRPRGGPRLRPQLGRPRRPRRAARRRRRPRPGSGRVMRLRSTEPGVQLYTAGDLNADVIGKGGVPYVKYAGLALETQKFPCSPNFSHFPATELQPGQLYRHRDGLHVLDRRARGHPVMTRSCRHAHRRSRHDRQDHASRRPAQRDRIARRLAAPPSTHARKDSSATRSSTSSRRPTSSTGPWCSSEPKGFTCGTRTGGSTSMPSAGSSWPCSVIAIPGWSRPSGASSIG